MTNNLKLITTETFGDLPCNFYRIMNNDILLTREQIGMALEYKNPDASLSMIHKRHKNRLDVLSVVTKLLSTDGKEYETTLYTQRGVMEICRWSNKPKANMFMDWVWDIIEKYRNNELLTPQSVDMKFITNAITSMTQALTTLTTNMTTMQQDIQALKQLEQQPQIETTYKKPYNPWFAKMQPKYKLLEEYFDITRGQLYKNILWELENLYSVDTQQIQADYCYENNISSCYPLEPYEFVPKYRDMIEQIVNSNLIKYGIASEDDPITSTKHMTIFDMPVKEKEK